MSVNLICGGISSGKTSETIGIIRKIKEKEPDAQIIMIVPEQYSYACEKLMTESFGGTGLNGIEVLTFSRMAKRYIPQEVKNYLTPSGKAVLISKAVELACEGEGIYSGCASKPGFANSVAAMLCELKRNMITPLMLRTSADKLDEGILKQKLVAVADIYEKYDELSSDRFLDSEDDLLHLSEIIAAKKIFDGTYIFIDEFSDFLPQHYNVIEALMKKCAEMIITLPIDEEKSPELSIIPSDTKRRIVKIARKNGIICKEKKLTQSGMGFRSDEIRFLFDNYNAFFKKDFSPYPDETKDISLFAAKDIYSEVEYTAKRIVGLISNGDIRYSDITIVLGGADSYKSIINAVFNDYKIPYFVDSSITITDHPILITVLSVFDIITTNWSYDAVFSYLKSGFIYIKDDEGVKPINEDDVDFLSSFVLKRGIRGKKKWLSEEDWEYNSVGLSESVTDAKPHEDTEADERINRTRRNVTIPLSHFIEKTKGRKKVYDFAKAFYEFLEEINLYEGLLYETQKLNEMGMRDEAEQFSKVWNMLVEVINQTAVTLVDEYCTKEQYRSYLLAGLGACEIGIIPSSMDCVTITGADVSVQKNVRIMFIMGALRGNIPPEISGEGMLSDTERERLSVIFQEYENTLGTTKEQKSVAEYRFYKTLFCAEEKLYISYPVNSFEGDAEVPSQLIYDLKRIFPKLLCYDDLLAEVNDDELLYSPKSALDYLLRNRNNKKDASVGGIYKWFMEHSEWTDKLKMVQTADNYKQTAAKITPENAYELYKNRAAYSVSRLNEFSSCPFKYYVKNGLKAKEEEIWQIQKFDLGSLMHYAIWRFCNVIEKNTDSFEALKQRWDSITDEECKNIIDEIMSEIKEKLGEIVERDEGKVNYLLNRMTRTLKRSAETIRKSIALGEYIPAEYEKKFLFTPDKNDTSYCIMGAIDRVDLAFSEEDKKAQIRIIDYKSGSKSFSVASICNMIDIQLVVYAMAAIDLYNKGELKYSRGDFSAEISGVLYNKLRDDLAHLDNAENDDVITEAVTGKQKLNGAIVLDMNDLGELDLSAAFNMDKGIKENAESEFLKFKLTKSGNVSKNSEYLTREQFEKLMNYAKKGIKSYNKRIKSGDIKVMPSKDNNELACRWCGMAEICLFDKDRDEVRPLCQNVDTAWQIIDENS